jgi:hypothetical protein
LCLLELINMVNPKHMVQVGMKIKNWSLVKLANTPICLVGGDKGINIV